MKINIKVKTLSQENKVIKDDKRYVVYVTDPPEKGKANRKVIKLISEFFKVPKSEINIIFGEKFSNKIVEINKFGANLPKSENLPISNQSINNKFQKYISKAHSWER